MKNQFSGGEHFELKVTIFRNNRKQCQFFANTLKQLVQSKTENQRNLKCFKKGTNFVKQRSLQKEPKIS